MGISETLAPSTEDYQLLGIPETSTDREIKHAYYVLAKVSHPDATPGTERSTATFDAVTQSFDRITAYRALHPEIASVPTQGWMIKEISFNLPVWTTPQALLIAPSGICYLAPEARCFPYESRAATVRIERDRTGYHVHLHCGQGQRWPMTAHAERPGLEVTSLSLWLTSATSSPMATQFIGSAPIVIPSPARLPRSFIQRQTASVTHHTMG